MTNIKVKSYDGVGATTLWLPLAIHGRLNPNRWGTCVDCGIDEGQYSKHYATMFDTVISIDANIRPTAREYLSDCDNVQLLEKCLWSEVGETLTWYELTNHTFLSSVKKEHIDAECKQWGIDKSTINKYDVTTDTLDNIINQPVDFLKVDCEMVDRQVIEGAEQLIAKYRPTVQLEAPTYGIVDILTKYNYQEYQHTECNFSDVMYLPK